MSIEPSFAVVIPCFNAGQTLGACIQSVLNISSDLDVLIIIVDDGSTDNTTEVAKAISTVSCKKIKIFSKANGGVSSARNLGLDLVRQNEIDYVLFLDADDVLLPNTLAHVIGIIHTAPQMDFISCCYKRLIEEQLENMSSVHKTLVSRPVSLNDYTDGSLVQSVSVCSTIFRVRALQAHSIRFSEDFAYGEDQLFMFQALSVLNGYLNKTELYGYVDRTASSAMGKIDIRQFELIDILDHVLFSNPLSCMNRHILERRKYRIYNSVLFRFAKQCDFTSFKVLYSQAKNTYHDKFEIQFEPNWYKVIKIFGGYSYWIYKFVGVIQQVKYFKS